MCEIIDNALPEDMYSELLEYARADAVYDTIKNDVDGVDYPLICSDIPDCVKSHIEKIAGGKVNAIFMRLSPIGVPVPHPVHNDISMGNKTVILYMFEDETAGTGIVNHIDESLSNEEAFKDCRDLSRWVLRGIATAKDNRAAVFDSNLMHVALPVGGFGVDQIDARLVLTAFLD